jgi:hypothetical protein
LKVPTEIRDEPFVISGKVPMPPTVKAILDWRKKNSIKGKINPFQPPRNSLKTTPTINTKRAKGNINPKIAKNGNTSGEISSLTFAPARINMAGSTIK